MAEHRLVCYGYIPKNKKLLTYPFCYIGFNPTGSSGKIFRYEEFKNGTPQFSLISEINPNPNICVIPQNYKSSNGENLGESCSISGYPNISWSVDVFNTWLSQNSETLQVNMQSASHQLELDLEQNQLNKTRGNWNMVSNIGSSVMQKNVFGVVGSVVDNEFNQQGLALDEKRLTTSYDDLINSQLAQRAYHSKLPNDATFGSNNTTLLRLPKI